MCRVDEDKWSFHTPNIIPDPDVATPTYELLLNNMDDPLAFLAWVWGVYSGEYDGRQVLWMHGPEGEEGKSVLANTVGEELFGPALGAIGNNHLTGKSQFLFSFFETSQLVVYSECNNSMALMTEAMKSISGDADTQTLERKGEQARFGRLSARVWICSNKKPVITGDHYNTSRLLFITIRRGEGERIPKKVFRSRLVAEMPGFLAMAQAAFAERCPKTNVIETNETVKRRVQRLMDKQYEPYIETFETHYEKGEWDWTLMQGDSIKAKEVQDLLQIVQPRADKYFITNFVEWLELTHGIEKRRTKHGFIYGGLKRKVVDLSSKSTLKSDF